MAEGVGARQRPGARGVGEVPAVLALRQRRARRRLGPQDCQVAAVELVGHPGQRQSAHVRAAADGRDQVVGLAVHQLELFARLQPDHGLVQQHVVGEGAHREARLGVGAHHLERLRDGGGLAARMVGVLREELAPHLGRAARAGMDGGAECLHQVAATGLVVVRSAHHVDHDLDPGQRPGERERRAPLPGASVGHKPPHALLLGVVNLRQRRIELVAARRACALVLPVPSRHLVGNADPPLERAILRHQSPRQQSREVVVGKRLLRLRIDELVRSARKVRQDVVPAVRYAVDREVDPLQRCSSHPCSSIHMALATEVARRSH